MNFKLCSEDIRPKDEKVTAKDSITVSKESFSECSVSQSILKSLR